MRRHLAAVLLGVLPLAAPTVLAQGQQPSDYFKTAQNFLANCDPRADAIGERPQENYLCLSYMAGLVEGYTTGALASGNRRPYCLPRPVTLVEMMDMLSVVIDRGVPPDMPTAAVFANILSVTFPCDRAPGAPSAAGAEPDAQASGGQEAAGATAAPPGTDAADMLTPPLVRPGATDQLPSDRPAAPADSVPPTGDGDAAGDASDGDGPATE